MKARAKKSLCEREDKRVTKELDLRSWESKKVNSFIRCSYCEKLRCIFYSVNDDKYTAAKNALKQKLESVSLLRIVIH